MNSLLTITITLLFLASHLVSSANSLPNNNSNQRRDELCHLLCDIDVIGFLYNSEEDKDSDEPIEREGDDLFLCRLQNDAYQSRTGYRITLPDDFLGLYEEEISSGTASICISSGEVDRDDYKIIIEENAELTLVSNRRRKLNANYELTIGTRSVLAIHLTSSFVESGTRRSEDPGLSTTEIEGTIFGTGPNAPGHDAISQYSACSHGALKLEPATGPNIVNGVAEVRLEKRIAGEEILGSLQDEVLEATERVVGSVDQYSHLIFCIPDDVLMDGSTKWTAFTYFHSHWSFFQKRRCSAMSVTIHELGHNIGFRHSGFETASYGDESGYMGYTVFRTGEPLKCFNGHKHWLTGWYQDRQDRVDPAMNEPVLKRLVSFTDYDKALQLNDVVLMRVGRYFLQYNRAKGMNMGTGMHADQVSITYAQNDASDSLAIAGLSAGDKHQLLEFGGTQYSLVIQVCEVGAEASQDSAAVSSRAVKKDASSSMIDYAWVSIHLDDGAQQPQCGRLQERTAIFSLPTTAPSVEPTPPPTKSPTVPPTSQPSAAPVESATPTSDTRTAKTTVFITLSDSENQQQQQEAPVPQMEKLRKRRHIPDLKHMNKLTKEEDEPVTRRLRLKGG